MSSSKWAKYLVFTASDQDFLGSGLDGVKPTPSSPFAEHPSSMTKAGGTAGSGILLGLRALDSCSMCSMMEICEYGFLYRFHEPLWPLRLLPRYDEGR